MKQIIIRRTGKFLTVEEARAFSQKVKNTFPLVQYTDHRSVYGYATEELAKRANLNAVLEAHEGYTFSFVGTENIPLEGYKVCVIGFKDLPADFEKKFPDYVVIG